MPFQLPTTAEQRWEVLFDLLTRQAGCWVAFDAFWQSGQSHSSGKLPVLGHGIGHVQGGSALKVCYQIRSYASTSLELTDNMVAATLSFHEGFDSEVVDICLPAPSNVADLRGWRLLPCSPKSGLADVDACRSVLAEDNRKPLAQNIVEENNAVKRPNATPPRF